MKIIVAIACVVVYTSKTINNFEKGHNGLKIVDATNPIPKYLQISAWLKELIQNGRYRPGEKLPSEVELSQVCGVNRNTLRKKEPAPLLQPGRLLSSGTNLSGF